MAYFTGVYIFIGGYWWLLMIIGSYYIGDY